MANKASCQLVILHRARSFLGQFELLTTYKVFIRSLMEYCSPIWTCAPGSHLAILDAMESKTLKIIGISHAVPRSVTFASQAGWLPLCILPPLFWSCNVCPLLVLALISKAIIYNQVNYICSFTSGISTRTVIINKLHQ